jgi:hypothetical protein
VQHILHMYAINDMQSKPHHQHQNPAECHIQDVKKVSNHIMDRTGSPSEYWLLSLLHTTYILNRLSRERLDWLTPYDKVTEQKPDISSILAFHWWEPMYYAFSNTSYPNTKERLARIVHIAEHQGDAMTWLLLDDITLKVVTRSAFRTASDKDNPILQVGNHKPIHSVIDLTCDDSKLRLPTLSPEDLIGLTFICELGNGNNYCITFVQNDLNRDAESH